MDHKSLMKLIMILKKNGITQYKDKDVELTLSLDSPKSTKQIYTADDSQATRPGTVQTDNKEEPTLTEDDFLYWSSGFDPKEMNKPQDPNNQ
jgi:hypothetical protein